MLTNNESRDWCHCLTCLWQRARKVKDANKAHKHEWTKWETSVAPFKTVRCAVCNRTEAEAEYFDKHIA